MTKQGMRARRRPAQGWNESTLLEEVQRLRRVVQGGGSRVDQFLAEVFMAISPPPDGSRVDRFVAQELMMATRPGNSVGRASCRPPASSATPNEIRR